MADLPDVRAAVELELGREIRRRLGNAHGVPEHDHRLILIRRRRVNLCRPFTIHRQAIQPHAREDRRLSRALPGFDVPLTEPAIPVLVNPTKPAPEYERPELRPDVKLEGLRLALLVY